MSDYDKYDAMADEAHDAQQEQDEEEAREAAYNSPCCNDYYCPCGNNASPPVF